MANGDKSVEKETFEIFSGGRVAQLLDYRKLTLSNNGQRKVFRSHLKQDKGHTNAWQKFVQSIENKKEEPIPFDEIFISTITTLAAMEAYQKNELIILDDYLAKLKIENP